MTVTSFGSAIKNCIDFLGDISLSKHANRGRGYWKFNNSLLEDTIFVEKINSHIQDVIQETFDLSDPRVKWEFLKNKISLFV